MQLKNARRIQSNSALAANKRDMRSALTGASTARGAVASAEATDVLPDREGATEDADDDEDEEDEEEEADEEEEDEEEEEEEEEDDSEEEEEEEEEDSAEGISRDTFNRSRRI